MLRLHGSPISNFYNIVKLSLLEKQLPFEEVRQLPSQDEDFLQISPLGKIPVLETEEGFLTETLVIAEYLEEICPVSPLLPGDPYQRACARRLCHMAEIYVDIPARPLLATRLTGASLSDERRAEVQGLLEKGGRGIARTVKPSPWMMGENITLADLFFYYCLELVAPMAREQLELDLYASLPGFAQWREAFSQRALVLEVDAAHRKVFDKFMQTLAARNGG